MVKVTSNNGEFNNKWSGWDGAWPRHMYNGQLHHCNIRNNSTIDQFENNIITLNSNNIMVNNELTKINSDMMTTLRGDV